MEILTNILSYINGIVWGMPMLILIVGVGAYLMFGLGFMPIVHCRVLAITRQYNVVFVIGYHGTNE